LADEKQLPPSSKVSGPARLSALGVDNGSLNRPGLYTGKAGVALALLEAVDRQRWLPVVLSSGLLD